MFPTSNFGRTRNKGVIKPPLINLDTYFEILNLQSDKFSNFTLENPNLVSTWKDLSANANNATQGTSANKPIFNTVLSPNGGVKYNGNNSKLQLGSEVTLTNGTIFIVYYSATDGSSTSLFGSSTEVNNLRYLRDINGCILLTVNNGTEQGEFQPIGGNGFRHIVVIRKNGTTWTFKSNDRTMTRGASVSTLANGSIKISGIGYQPFTNNLFCADNIHAILATATIMSDADIFTVTGELMSRYSVAGPSDISIVGFGDSITQNETSYPVLPDLGTLMGLPVINCGLTGSKASNATGAVNNGQDRCASTVVSRPYKDKVYVFFGANDIGDGGITTQNFQDAYTAMTTTLLNAGYSPSNICLVSPPYRLDYNSTYKTREDAFVAAVHTVATTLHVCYANVLQPLLDTGNPDSYMFDGLHPTAAGAQIYANTIYAGFQAGPL